jgi:hypothetical protein
VPLILGFIWYHPKVFGAAWMKAGGFDEAKMKEGFNMPLVFGLTLVFGFFISTILSGLTIHQMGFFAMLQKNFTDPATQEFFNKGVELFGNDFRTFKHGMLHGTIAGIGLAMPLVVINGLFERKNFKHMAIDAGFWILCFMLMCGIICQFADLNTVG